MRPPAKYCFVSPSGEVFRGENIRKFAKEHGLDPGNLQNVYQGARNSHKGWTAPQMENICESW